MKKLLSELDHLFLCTQPKIVFNSWTSSRPILVLEILSLLTDISFLDSFDRYGDKCCVRSHRILSEGARLIKNVLHYTLSFPDNFTDSPNEQQIVLESCLAHNAKEIWNRGKCIVLEHFKLVGFQSSCGQRHIFHLYTQFSLRQFPQIYRLRRSFYVCFPPPTNC